MNVDLQTPDKQYHRILTKKMLTPSFFQDSTEHGTKQNSDEKSDSAQSFKFSKEHTLNVFN